MFSSDTDCGTKPEVWKICIIGKSSFEKKTTVLEKQSLQGSVLSYTISFEALHAVQVLVTQNFLINFKF